MIKVLTLFCLISVVGGDYPCCTVRAWEAIQGFLLGSVYSGKPQEHEGLSLISYDQDRLMINSYTEQSSTIDGIRKYRYLQDFKNKVHYMIDETGCTKQKDAAPFPPPCVPAGSVKVTSYYYGGSKSPLYVDVYRTPVVSTEHGFVTVTTNGCVPVAQANYGGNEQSAQMRSFSYSNFTVGIRNTTVFDIPAECKHASFLNVKPMHVDHFRRTVLY